MPNKNNHKYSSYSTQTNTKICSLSYRSLKLIKSKT